VGQGLSPSLRDGSQLLTDGSRSSGAPCRLARSCGFGVGDFRVVSGADTFVLKGPIVGWKRLWMALNPCPAGLRNYENRARYANEASLPTQRSVRRCPIVVR
jgi:hypothetical protein